MIQDTATALRRARGGRHYVRLTRVLQPLSPVNLAVFSRVTVVFSPVKVVFSPVKVFVKFQAVGLIMRQARLGKASTSS